MKAQPWILGLLLLAIPAGVSSDEGVLAPRGLELQTQHHARSILGEVRLESYGERPARIVVGIDDSIPRDGLLDHLILFETSRASSVGLFFQGLAQVEVTPFGVRLLALEERVGYELMVEGFADVTQFAGATRDRSEIVLFEKGRSLVVKTLPFDRLLESVVEVALAETDRSGRVRLQAAGLLQKDPSADGEDSCGLTCSKSCRGSGSCSATCPGEGDCAHCECTEGNIPLCECR